MQIMADTALRQIRQSLGVSQETLARRTRSVSLGTVKNAEVGKPIRYGNAQQLLTAINALLQEAGRDPVTLEDLGLTLF
jgi:DNA-binding transcriptional regulator YiaG